MVQIKSFFIHVFAVKRRNFKYEMNLEDNVKVDRIELNCSVLFYCILFGLGDCINSIFLFILPCLHKKKREYISVYCLRFVINFHLSHQLFIDSSAVKLHERFLFLIHYHLLANIANVNLFVNA